MDTLAHGLYGAALLAHTKDERLMVAAGFMGMLPDVIVYATGVVSRTDPTKFIDLYRWTHSLLPLSLVALVLLVFKRKWLILLAPYLLHLLFDVPLHCGVFSTRLFYPLSDFHVCGINYADNWWAWEVNYGILVGIFYLIYLKFYKPFLTK